jgi:hypothetical protein
MVAYVVGFTMPGVFVGHIPSSGFIVFLPCI